MGLKKKIVEIIQKEAKYVSSGVADLNFKTVSLNQNNFGQVLRLSVDPVTGENLVTVKDQDNNEQVLVNTSGRPIGQGSVVFFSNGIIM